MGHIGSLPSPSRSTSQAQTAWNIQATLEKKQYGKKVCYLTARRVCCVLELFASPWITGGSVATETRLLLPLLPTCRSVQEQTMCVEVEVDATNNKTLIKCSFDLREALLQKIPEFYERLS